MHQHVTPLRWGGVSWLPFPVCKVFEEFHGWTVELFFYLNETSVGHGHGVLRFLPTRLRWVQQLFLHLLAPAISPECRLECSLDYGGHVYVATLITLVNSAYS